MPNSLSMSGKLKFNSLGTNKRIGYLDNTLLPPIAG
jgi:hypothetical protein